MQNVALITGGSKGIGLAIAEKFLRNGFKVITLSRTEGDSKDLKSEFGDQLEQYFLDLKQSSEIKITCNQILSKYSQISVLVNNAGTFLPGKISEEEAGVFESQIQLNVGSAYHTTRAILPAISKGAYIFNICSTASIVPYINGGSYCISKHALLGFSKVLRQELLQSEILVSSVLPGATKTESWDGVDLPESRFIKPSNIANAIFSAWENRENCVFEELLIRPILGDI